jgi:5-methylcytosine-specific restriction endonuclease McrA
MKIDRQAVYDKYQGHCAYCGQAIEFKAMQVDHKHPVHLEKWCLGPEELRKMHNLPKYIDDHENLMPTCRRCNHYKRGLLLEDYRKQLKTLHERIEKIYINKVGINYGIIVVKPWDGEFYFEYYEKCEKRWTDPSRSLIQ